MALRTLIAIDTFYFIMWIEIHWSSSWLKAQSHMTSPYTWGSVTTLHDFGGVLGRPLDTFFWALTISWSWLLAHVWSGPELHFSLTFLVYTKAMCWLRKYTNISYEWRSHFLQSSIFLRWPLYHNSHLPYSQNPKTINQSKDLVVNALENSKDNASTLRITLEERECFKV
jgi:hypothetical protein